MAAQDSTATADHRRLKIIAGADSFGCTLKDALVTHLRSLNIDVEDLGTDKYYSVGSKIGSLVSSSAGNTSIETRGLLACGTGVGVSIFANKFPGVYAATCTSIAEAQNCRSINNSNVLSLSGMSTSPEVAVEILSTWLNTPFKSPCPASNSEPWPNETESFFDNSVTEMWKIGRNEDELSESCAICDLVKRREFVPVEMIPGGSMKIVRENPTSAIVRFKAGSVEPAHHHTFGHDLIVIKGSKRVWNLSNKERYDLGAGDFLFTPAADVHRVEYFEDTEFFLRWDGHWDILLDEDLDTARAALEKEV
ncbi:DNA damage-repair/toleration protein DRT102 [Apium graveolens]|uniref:DNA damage-repair/toleration protein DRT102 n=1 Tax=Apium graveolens TaxID=4045 RepID=UPI003D7AEE82